MQLRAEKTFTFRIVRGSLWRGSKPTRFTRWNYTIVSIAEWQLESAVQYSTIDFTVQSNLDYTNQHHIGFRAFTYQYPCCNICWNRNLYMDNHICSYFHNKQNLADCWDSFHNQLVLSDHVVGEVFDCLLLCFTHVYFTIEKRSLESIGRLPITKIINRKTAILSGDTLASSKTSINVWTDWNVCVRRYDWGKHYFSFARSLFFSFLSSFFSFFSLLPFPFPSFPLSTWSVLIYALISIILCTLTVKTWRCVLITIY